MIATYGFHFEHPWWLLTALFVVPVVWLALRSLKALNVVRRVAAIVLRGIVVLILAAVLGRPAITKVHEAVTLLAVIDRSNSVPEGLRGAAHAYLVKALAGKPAGDQLAVVNVAALADIVRLPSTSDDVPKRVLGIALDQSRLAAGIQMALAIAPPDTAVRILLISDGNETDGDLKEVARVAAANGIPIDVLALRYNHKREVVFRRLVAPSRARSGQTIPVRFVLTSTHKASGRLILSLNGRPVDLDPTSDGVTAAVDLKAGTNVKTIQMPVGTRGVHEMEATFLADDENTDRLLENNRASAVTFVAGPGHVLIVSADARESAPLVRALREANIDTRDLPAGQMPTSLTGLLDTDAVVLVNTPNYAFTAAQQEMLVRYVSDLGGGLLTVGGPDSYGAGGWIGSPVAQILPVDMDPPQKKQMPKGALILVMHACEMPRGNYWGKRVAIEAVSALGRRDLVGVLDYSWGAGMSNWVYKLQPAGDKKRVKAAIKKMVMGDMPNLAPPIQAAYDALSKAPAGQKHIIVISDGDPGLPSSALMARMRKSRITCTTVAVFPHQQADVQRYFTLARKTGGRRYQPKNADELPKIFVKEAQVVRRSLISEEPFTPRVALIGSELLGGVRAVPPLQGRVLTGRKGGLSQVLLAGPEGEPVLASTQAGLGRVVSFTSSADSRWAKQWLAWGGFGRFWEQAVRWVARSPRASDCEVFSDVQGRDVTVTVEAVQSGGKFVQFAHITGQVISPNMGKEPLALRQIGPGQYRASFRTTGETGETGGGSYLINLRYRKAGEGEKHQMVQAVVNVPFAPEYEDLTDNAALLAEVASITSGRLLDTRPEQADLFARTGLVPPRAFTPLTRPLFIVWVVLFLLDVATRRIAVDVRAVARRIGISVTDLAVGAAGVAVGLTVWVLVLAGVWFFRTYWVWFAPAATGVLFGSLAYSLRKALGAGRRAAAASRTLSALKTRRQKVRKRLDGKRDPHARRRFVAGKGSSTDLPEADLSREAPDRRPAAEPPTEEPAPPPEAGPQTHVSRLLDAKRRAAERRKGK